MGNKFNNVEGKITNRDRVNEKERSPTTLTVSSFV